MADVVDDVSNETVNDTDNQTTGNSEVSGDAESAAQITSFQSSTTYSDAVSAYNNAKITSTGEIVGGDQLTLIDKIGQFFKSNWLIMLITFIMTMVLLRTKNNGTNVTSTGGFKLWKR